MPKRSPNKTTEVKGVIERVAGDELAYVRSIEDGRTFSFTTIAVAKAKGKSLSHLKVRPKQQVKFHLDSKKEKVESVQPDRAKRILVKKARASGKRQQVFSKSAAGVPSPIQCELLPSKSAKGVISMGRALPAATRRFGKLIDTSKLQPGDLLLTREPKGGDVFSKLIATVQADGGYGPDHSRWVHVAMYLGDDASVVEASFDHPLTGGDVRITSLDDYCDGKFILRFRRSRFVSSEQDGWKICVRALSRLKVPYDFGSAIRMWFDVKFRGIGFYKGQKARATSSAVICSTLYADSYNEATRRSLGETCGACVPAWLSGSDEFEDVATNWLTIK